MPFTKSSMLLAIVAAFIGSAQAFTGDGMSIESKPCKPIVLTELCDKATFFNPGVSFKA